jgi:hypothetical protein
MPKAPRPLTLSVYRCLARGFSVPLRFLAKYAGGRVPKKRSPRTSVLMYPSRLRGKVVFRWSGWPVGRNGNALVEQSDGRRCIVPIRSLRKLDEVPVLVVEKGGYDARQDTLDALAYAAAGGAAGGAQRARR